MKAMKYLMSVIQCDIRLKSLISKCENLICAFSPVKNAWMTENSDTHFRILSNFHSINWPSVAGTRSLKTAPAKSLRGSWNFELSYSSDWSILIT